MAQLSGSVAEKSAYHHGEVSLQETIVKLAQNFVGSNNLNLLKPIGMFGSRLQGGKDHAASRYIHTKVEVKYFILVELWVKKVYHLRIIPYTVFFETL